ncbi:bifunctional diaminohydroxyphosphoribosylaminopyrimidine deaminase/5-amino-6-(5-phosphoribosylamino)uracil reductase RibD [Desulfovibrionales bacterium]
MSDEMVFMQRAIALAEQGRGATAPNPCVGAVLVRDQTIVAEGWHRAYGQPHAEVEVLADAARNNVDPAQCTLYVTLEPCHHHGKTPPCTQAIVKAGIPAVVMGCLDPNTSVPGGGKAFLEQHGITVRHGLCAQACQDLIADFQIWQTTDRPYVIAKLATTLDGKIATRTGHAAWISSEQSRAEVHALRSWCQAVLVGGETYRADNPALTCRLPGYTGPQPLAVVVTRTLPKPDQSSFLLTERPDQTIFCTTEAEAKSARAESLKEHHVRVWGLPAAQGMLDLREGLRLLRATLGCHYVLTEGGGHLSASLHMHTVLDELRIYQAMKILGDADGRSAFAGRNVHNMRDAWKFRLLEQRWVDTDLYLRLRPME